MASTKLSRLPSTTGNRRTFTISAWIKRSKLGARQAIFSAADTGSVGSGGGSLRFESDDKLRIVFGGGDDGTINSTRVFRDTSAWYHIVWRIDTTQSTASDRAKLWVNGEEETLSFSTNISQNYDTAFNYASTNQYTHFGAARDAGSQGDANTHYFDGSMAHIHLTDGQAYSASDFGETESSSGIWKPKVSPSVTYGTNGVFLKCQDSSSLGDDSSGNTNDFTLSGSGTQTLDTPSNVFATMNALSQPTSNAPSYSNGNTTVSTTDASLFGGFSTLGVTQGKWYAEFKKVSQDSGTADDGYRSWPGVTYVTNADSNPSSTAGYYLLIGTGRAYNGSTDLGLLAGTSYISDNGILQIALDLDNNQVSFGFNGGWMDGSAGWTNSTPSNWISITDPASTEAGYFFTCGDSSTLRSYTTNWNFGSGYFGTTAVSSANSDSAGIGQFEYSVPSGYYALCTKNIAEYG